MKRLAIVFALFLMIGLSGSAFSQNMSTWEIKWNFYNYRHEGLMILANNAGTFRVRVIDRNTGNIVDVVDQYVNRVADGNNVFLRCYNPVSHYGGSYSADNFLLKRDGSMMMMDDNGNWSTEISIRQVSSMNDLVQMKNKYGL